MYHSFLKIISSKVKIIQLRLKCVCCPRFSSKGPCKQLWRLAQINVGGNFYDLIKNLYDNSTGSVRIGDFKTQSFQYARGVRQGCILSPLLFNLYINDLPYSFENILSDPFVLPNGAKLSSLLYADDLFYSITIKGRTAKLSQYFGPVLQIVDVKHKYKKKQNYDFPTTSKKI